MYHNRVIGHTCMQLSWAKCDYAMSGTLLVPSESLGDSLWYLNDGLHFFFFVFTFQPMKFTEILSSSRHWRSSYYSHCILEFSQPHLILIEKCQTMSFGSIETYFSPLVLISIHSEERMQFLFLPLKSLKVRPRQRYVVLKVATNSREVRMLQDCT